MMRLSILLLMIGVCGLVLGEPINVAIPAAVPQRAAVVESKPFQSQPIVETPSLSSSSITSKPFESQPVVDTSSSLPVHLLPIKLELGDAAIDELGTSLESSPAALNVDNDPSHEGLVDIGGDVNVDITILAGLEADAAQTASGELTSFEGASEEEIKSILEGVVDEQDLDAFEGISDADIDADGDTMIETDSSLEGKDEDETDKEEHEKQEKEEEEKEEKEGNKEAKEKDASGTEIEVESGIKVENPVNHGEVTVNYVENLNLNLRSRNHKFRDLHYLARKLRLMKRIAKWFSKPVHARLSLLRFAKYHKLRVLELKLRLMKLKFLTDAIKMLRLARLISIMKLKGDLTKLAIGHALFRKYRQPTEDVQSDVKETISNRLAKIRAFKNLLRARRMAKFRTMMTSPILSRRAFHSPAFTTSPIVSAWNRPTQFMTSPILSPEWAHPVSGHFLALRGVDDGSDGMENEGLYEDLLQQQQLQQHPSFPFTTAPIMSETHPLQHPYNIMLAGESDPSEAEAEPAEEYDTGDNDYETDEPITME